MSHVPRPVFPCSWDTVPAMAWQRGQGRKSIKKTVIFSVEAETVSIYTREKIKSLSRPRNPIIPIIFGTVLGTVIERTLSSASPRGLLQ